MTVTRWDWSWESQHDERSAERSSDGLAGSQPDDGQAGSQKLAEAIERSQATPDSAEHSPFRRRRMIATLALIAAAALLLTALRSPGGRARQTRPAHHRVRAVQLSATRRAALMERRETQAINSVLSYTPAVVEGGRKGNEVALTFDDGPGPYTQRLVAVLDGLHVRATFFAIGEEEQYFSAGTLAELRSGDVVGDHTETHPMMALISAHEQHEELSEQALRIELLGGPEPRLFRPPYGSFNAITLRELHRMHMLMILWSTDTSDYALPGSQAIVQRVLAGAHPGAIILMHDGGGNREETIAALPAIVRGLRRRELHPVTVPRLLLDDPPPRGRPIPRSLAGD
jgi:peptidoglycan-N-acetylglucosamine deacetylase